MSIDHHAWEKFSQGQTPGTTPLPTKLTAYLSPSSDKLVIDVGCGWGRGAFQLFSSGYSVIGTDINTAEITQAKLGLSQIVDQDSPNTISFQVGDASKHINVPDQTADAVVVNGVLLAMVTPKDRQNFITEIHRILKQGGILYLAEFGQTSDEQYPIDYRKHALITGEYGTIVSFKPELKVSFKDKTDQEILALNKPENIDYFAHHYSEEELKSLLTNFKIIDFVSEKFTTRSGKKINGFVVYCQKS